MSGLSLAEGRVVVADKTADAGQDVFLCLEADKLIVNPGGDKASLVALDRRTGRVVWAAPGEPAAYASFILGEFGGRRQIVGYDRTSVGGWDVATGERLWRLGLAQ
jgi:hypothetical protein